MRCSNRIIGTALHYLNTEGIPAEPAGLGLFMVNGEICNGFELIGMVNEWRALDGLAPLRETDQ